MAAADMLPEVMGNASVQTVKAERSLQSLKNALDAR